MGGVGVWPLPSAPGTTVSMAASTVPTTPALTAASVSTPGSVFTSLPAFTGTSPHLCLFYLCGDVDLFFWVWIGGADPDFPHTALSSAHSNLRDAFLLFSEQFPARAEFFGARGRELTYGPADTQRRYDSRERGYGGGSGAGTPGYHTPGTPGGYGYEDAKGGYYGYAKPGDFTRPGMGHRDSNMSSTSPSPSLFHSLFLILVCLRGV